MKYFTAIYMMPVAGLDTWMQKPEAERKEMEDKMKRDWDAWLAGHQAAVKNTIALGKTKRVSSAGVEDARNGFMLSSYVEAESLEAAAEIFKNHPHLEIPEATIEVIETRQM
jgi:hypothetical protein